MLDTWSELSAPPPHTAPLEYVGELGTLHVLRDKGESGVTPIAIIMILGQAMVRLRLCPHLILYL